MINSKNAQLGASKATAIATSNHSNQRSRKWRSMTRARHVSTLCLAVAALLAGSLDSAEAAPRGTTGKPGDGGNTKTVSFNAVNLGVLPGDMYSSASSVSESGSVVGYSWYDTPAWDSIYSPAYWYFNGQEWDAYALPKEPAESDGAAFGITGPVDAVEYVVGRIDSAAVIWTVTGNTSFSQPTRLDTDNACKSSQANSVNMDLVAVGMCDDRAVIWTPAGNGYAATMLPISANRYTEARDVNDNGVVVGRNCALSGTSYSCFAFVLKSDSSTVTPLDDQIAGNPYSTATRVSDVVTVDGEAVVYVTGYTTSADDVSTGTRWTVPVAVLEGSSGEVTQVTLTKSWCSGVNNVGDAVCTSSGSGRQTTAIVRNGVENSLKPPKKVLSAASLDLARTHELPTYAVGNAPVDGLRAVVWVIDK
jgi:hypothetical protein